MDPLADMITKLRNAGSAGHESVFIPHSKMKESVIEVLKKEGFVKNYSKKSKGGKPALLVELFSENRVPRIKGAKRVSKPSKRIYRSASELRPVKNGYGLLVISTPQGVMSGRDARKSKVGGEVLFSIW